MMGLLCQNAVHDWARPVLIKVGVINRVLSCISCDATISIFLEFGFTPLRIHSGLSTACLCSSPRSGSPRAPALCAFSKDVTKCFHGQDSDAQDAAREATRQEVELADGKIMDYARTQEKCAL